MVQQVKNRQLLARNRKSGCIFRTRLDESCPAFSKQKCSPRELFDVEPMSPRSARLKHFSSRFRRPYPLGIETILPSR